MQKSVSALQVAFVGGEIMWWLSPYLLQHLSAYFSGDRAGNCPYNLVLHGEYVVEVAVEPIGPQIDRPPG